MWSKEFEVLTLALTQLRAQRKTHELNLSFGRNARRIQACLHLLLRQNRHSEHVPWFPVSGFLKSCNAVLSDQITAHVWVLVYVDLVSIWLFASGVKKHEMGPFETMLQVQDVEQQRERPPKPQEETRAAVRAGNAGEAARGEEREPRKPMPSSCCTRTEHPRGQVKTRE